MQLCDSLTKSDSHFLCESLALQDLLICEITLDYQLVCNYNLQNDFLQLLVMLDCHGKQKSME